MRLLKSHLPLFAMMVLLSATLTSCMIGPDFHPPAAPQIDSYTESPKPLKTINAPKAGKAGKTQHFTYDRDIPGNWWYIFHSRALNQLIEQGLANSPNLAAAKAALAQSQDLLYAQIGSSLLPSVTTQFSGQRLRFNGAQFGIDTPLRAASKNIFNLFNASVSVNYTLDVFGGLRRQIEVYGAQVDYQRFELEAAFLTMSTNIVTTAITIASLRAQIKACLLYTSDAADE